MALIFIGNIVCEQFSSGFMHSAYYVWMYMGAILMVTLIDISKCLWVRANMISQHPQPCEKTVLSKIYYWFEDVGKDGNKRY